jgi:manganese transport protein
MISTRLGQSVPGDGPGFGTMLRFLGPAIMVSVGFMDPGNWATDLEGGSRFGYQLLWVLLASNAIAILLQILAVRLGIAAGRDLAQACRDQYPQPVARALWLLCEIAIIACDLAEVLGSAIALNLLFGIPLLAGAVITGLDVLLIIGLQQFGIRRLEAVVAVMVLTIGGCLALEVLRAQPVWAHVAQGLAPRLNPANLYIAIGILGATVMPHNLYLHSSLVQTRQIGASVRARRRAIRYSSIGTVLALSAAFIVNAAILVMAAATFFTRRLEVTELRQAYALLTPLLGGQMAAVAFAVALLASGQSSTITGTLAGQVVMEGFLDLRISPVLRRLATRGLAILPAVIVLMVFGDSAVVKLLVLTQVALSLQLPFAMAPLVRFTSQTAIMGGFASPAWLRLAAWTATAGIAGLNVWLVARMVSGPGLLQAAGAWLALPVLGVAVALGGLLLWTVFGPLEAGRPDARRPERGRARRGRSDWPEGSMEEA